MPLRTSIKLFVLALGNLGVLKICQIQSIVGMLVTRKESSFALPVVDYSFVLFQAISERRPVPKNTSRFGIIFRLSRSVQDLA